MKYRFIQFTLNTKTSELETGGKSVLLKQKQFLLLKCLIENPREILSKDLLIKEVWQDRLVSDNTIAKTVAQLRNLIGDDGKLPQWIITHRGRGISFTPDVEVVNESLSRTHETNFRKPLMFIVTCLLFVVIWQMFFNNKEGQHTSAPNILIMADLNAADSASNRWLQKSIAPMLSDLWSREYPGKIMLLDKASDLPVDEYLNKQWEINPQLNVITTELTENDSGYLLLINFNDEKQIQRKYEFDGKTISEVLQNVSIGLGRELNAELKADDLIKFFPVEQDVIELYMRGLAAADDHEYEKAAQYFNLSLVENSDFHLAQLQLADMKKYLGQTEEALVLLDTLQSSPLYPKIELQAVDIRGYIFDLQGRVVEARDLYENVLKKKSSSPAHELNPLRFNLSYVYTNLNELDSALALLNQIEASTTLADDPMLYAASIHKKASILQSLGHTQQAEKEAKKSLSTYLKLGELLGTAKVHSLLARINILKSDYIQAKHHLYESLSITKKLDFKLGIGASINELVYLLLKEGDFDQAEKLNAEMEAIALEIQYSHMLIAAKQHSASLAIARGDWQVAEQFLQQHEQLSKSSKNQTALMTGYFLQLEYLVEKKHN